VQRLARWHDAARLGVCAALLTLVATVPELDGRRALLAVTALALVASLLLSARGRASRVSVLTVTTEGLVVAAASSLAGRHAWAGIPLVLVVLTFTAAVFGRRVAAPLALACGGLVAMAAVVNATLPLAAAMVAVYAICAAAVVGFVGYLEDVQRQFHHDLTSLLDKLDLVVWETDRAHPERTIVMGPVERLTGADPDRFMERAAGLSRGTTRHGDQGGVAPGPVVRARQVVHGGATRWIEEALELQRDLRGAVISAHGSVRDITAAHEREQMRDRFAQFVAAVPVGVILLRRVEQTPAGAGSAGAETISVNPAVEQLLDRAPGSLTQRPVPTLWQDMRSFFPERDVLRQVNAAVEHHESEIVEFTSLFAPGRAPRQVSIRVAPLPDELVAVLIEDVSDRHRSASDLAHRATHDALTGLANRAMLLDALDEHIDRADGRPVPLLLLDLDQFKEVNDSFGHQQGDAMLIAVADRLRTAVPPRSLVARLGGDEFAVLPKIGTTVAEAEEIAQRIARSLENPVELAPWLTLQTGASVGIAVYPDHATDVSELVMRADVAMYAAKRGGADHTVYAASHDRSSTRRMMLLGDMRRAITQGELEIHIQPVVTPDRTVVAAEALVRWRHPEHGLLAPPDFIELVEPTSLNRLVALEVAQQAVATLADFHRDGIDIEININLTARNLADDVVIDRLVALVGEYGIGRGALGVELTERQLVDDVPTVRRATQRLREAGIRFSIDDFGTGHSSLWTLRRLPCDELKLDRTFADDLSGAGDTVVNAVVNLAHGLGLVVVAEGVEDDATLRLVTQLGCDRIQGFLIAPALTPEAFRSFVRDTGARLARTTAAS
jgi:diguanylate cyclase (GGDEF)-like protein